MKQFLFVAIATFLSFISFDANAQFSIGGDLGYASPKGTNFEKDTENSTSFGIAWDIYFLYDLNDSFSVGVERTTNAIFASAGDDEGVSDASIYGLTLYGAKARYNATKGKTKLYAAATLGYAILETPEVTEATTGTVLIPSEKGGGFGIQPELGVQFGSFVISSRFLIPTKVELYDVERTAGSLQFSLGYNYSF